MNGDIAALASAALAVTVACLIPNRYLPRLPNDKLMHALAFGALTVLALPLAQTREQMGFCLLAVFLGGILIEGLQEFVSDRGFCWRDIAANTAGIALAAAASLLYAAH